MYGNACRSRGSINLAGVLSGNVAILIVILISRAPISFILQHQAKLIIPLFIMLHGLQMAFPKFRVAGTPRVRIRLLEGHVVRFRVTNGFEKDR